MGITVLKNLTAKFRKDQQVSFNICLDTFDKRTDADSLRKKLEFLNHLEQQHQSSVMFNVINPGSELLANLILDQEESFPSPPPRTAPDQSPMFESQEIAGNKFIRINPNNSKCTLVLLGPIGLSWRVWTTMLPGLHRWDVVIPQYSSTDFEEGQQTAIGSTEEDSDNVAIILKNLQSSSITVAAWCDGNDIAVSLVNRGDIKAKSFVCISPSFKTTKKLLAYESELMTALQNVVDKPAFSSIYAGLFRNSLNSTDIEENAIINQDAVILDTLRKPSWHARKLINSVYLQPNSLAFYAKRYLNKINLEINKATFKGVSTYLIQGELDNIVDNREAEYFLESHGISYKRICSLHCGHYTIIDQPEIIWRVLDKLSQ
ncbi:alpha/beta hydrolase [Pseudomonas coronafaciens]|uniref:alpha/beta hydrolase n=1 Tax=Pseudomonas coronafaciens TaxID=53409 RepID=UPI000EFE7368|nr:alpha/beta hydrolase [Pseudomonas coronafaciens]RMV63318.1 hypothetical protein ALP06_200094 [Pseudomonas coronafaciens pv. atropurpurea]